MSALGVALLLLLLLDELLLPQPAVRTSASSATVMANTIAITRPGRDQHRSMLPPLGSWT